MRQTKVSTWAGSSPIPYSADLGFFHIWQLLNPAKHEVTCDSKVEIQSQMRVNQSLVQKLNFV